MKVIGLMITKDDETIFGDWCRSQLPLYDAVVCLDGSESAATASIAQQFRDRLIHLHEGDFQIPSKNDHGLRRVVHEEITRTFGTDNWIMCCHADEFCYHDPRKVVQRAEQDGFDSLSWFSLHFYPHPLERAGWQQRQDRPIEERFRFYHWDFQGSGLPWREDRLYRNHRGVFWDQTTHGCVRPHGLKSPAPYHPILKHYKVFTMDLAWYEGQGPSTYFRNHWPELAHRTGLPFRVEKWEDLFVAAIPNYRRCDRFDGSFFQTWNMGEEFRPEKQEISRMPKNEAAQFNR
jgi:hypothetical protein